MIIINNHLYFNKKELNIIPLLNECYKIENKNIIHLNIKIFKNEELEIFKNFIKYIIKIKIKNNFKLELSNKEIFIIKKKFIKNNININNLMIILKLLNYFKMENYYNELKKIFIFKIFSYNSENIHLI